MAETPHVLIVGAGIVGASIAWHLAAAGARVTIVDAAESGGVATRNSWAWINASWGYPEPYYRLRRRSMDEWHRLESQVPALSIAWTGALNWELTPDELEAFAVERAGWGYDVRRVDRAEAARLEPRLAAPPDLALHVASEGAVEPLAAATALIEAARGLGAELISHRRVTALEMGAGRVTGVLTETGRIAADEVVIAAGTGTGSLAATAGFALPMLDSPALIITSKPHRRLLNGLVVTPEMELRQTAEGRFLAGTSCGDTEPEDHGVAAAAALFEKVQAMLAEGSSLEFEGHRIGWRPMPADGFPAIGRMDSVPGAYVAVMHSGITLAPVVGQLVTEEILTGRRDALLQPYGLGRFATASSKS